MDPTPETEHNELMDEYYKRFPMLMKTLMGGKMDGKQIAV